MSSSSQTVDIDLSVIVSVFNEEPALDETWEQLHLRLQTLEKSWEVLFVDDGSSDGSLSKLLLIARTHPNVKVVRLSRNFGHEAAMLAGLDQCRGKAAVCMDADLQHPPECLPEMLEKFHQGYQIVHMVRSDNEGAGRIEKLRSRLFYALLNLISPEGFSIGASDFFLVSEPVYRLLRQEYRERTRFLRGIIQVIGFKRTQIPFIAPTRVAGRSKYSFFKLANFSLTALATFSKLPLRISLLLGAVFAAFSAIVGIYSIIMKIMQQVTPGYTTIVVLVAALFSVQLVVLGIIGEYIGYIFDEIKRRPLYIIDNTDAGPDA